ncbi:hypothetical protein GCM10010102_06160 [Promicromonospora citrea]|uniref:Uncharacterized protein n=1 Tax=Promicromonospora citrea TaxID=43677 RepID=A0A8H9GDS5_9MICO|nr:hypothetical protein GCM10010102_06160 [Promicromonospora citrea]
MRGSIGSPLRARTPALLMRTVPSVRAVSRRARTGERQMFPVHTARTDVDMVVPSMPRRYVHERPFGALSPESHPSGVNCVSDRQRVNCTFTRSRGPLGIPSRRERS